MAEDGESTRKQTSSYRPQETFQRTQETQAEHGFPVRPPGIVSLPPGSRGPRSLYLKRHGDSFGFTLRHFIVYPPDSITEDDGRHAAVGALLTPMDTIFVKNVAEGSPAKQAGLQRGDRIISVNGIQVADQSYSQVVRLIQRSPEYLHLLVVPKEDDVLQQYFAETAYNPVSNQAQAQAQAQRSHRPDDKQAALRFLTHALPVTQKPTAFKVDASSWRMLQNPYGYKPQRNSYGHEQENVYSIPAEVYRSSNPRLLQNIYTEPSLHESIRRPRAQPQVPLYRKMGRRASEGNALSDRDSYCEISDYCLNNPGEMVVSNSKMRAVSKTAYAPDSSSQSRVGTSATSYPNTAGCRLSLDGGGRRESASSLASSLADGSKDSLSSFDSVSTLTGQETDDSLMIRLRKRQQQKEEFLRRPSTTTEPTLIQREFYGKPKKLEKPMWPPCESPSRVTPKPSHQNLQRVKTDMESERDMVQQRHQNGANVVSGGAVTNASQQRTAKSPKDWPGVPGMEKMYEASPAPAGLDNIENMNGSASGADTPCQEDQRPYPPNYKIVSKRARQFEKGQPQPEDDDDIVQTDRTSFYRSELENMSSKILVPNVAVRTREFETRSSEPRSNNLVTNSNNNNSILKKSRDSRSLESSGSNASSNDILNLRSSGNVMISTGSKYIHCPLPSDYRESTDISGNLDNQPVRTRDRSNSVDSWASALQELQPEEQLERQDSLQISKNTDEAQQEAMDLSHPTQYADLPPLIPEPVERMQVTPALAITPAPASSPKSPAIRPNQLDLGYPTRPARHLRPPSSPAVDSSSQRSVSPVGGDPNKPVVIRRTKNTNLADEERAMRRESYLKATEGGRMHFDSDMSDGDISPQVLRSGSVSGGSSSSVSLEREKFTGEDKERQSIIKEGLLHCKITEIDGKRAADRSWKQIWAVLVGPKLYLYKDRHHQSPVGVPEAAEQSLANGVDMRSSVVRVAEDYTKRKHVLRVSSVEPCRAEFLLQADNTADLADWVKVLQEQVAASTELETKLDPLSGNKQQAVPQTIPAQTSIQVQGSSRLSPQPSTKSKSSSTRNRSPTGQSPVSKTRKPSQVNELCTSPKSKTWRGRVAKQFRKIHQGASSPNSPTAPEGSTFGVPIEQCIPSLNNQYIPRFVEICTGIVDERGLGTIGIYRVPGNNASVTALTEEVNKNYDDVPQEDPRWNDVHVVSSLLKSYFRKMPESLVTNALYQKFIEADKIEDPRLRLEEIKNLIHRLPPHNYHTLKHVILHLRKVVSNSEVNKMEAKNLAIVFGPTIVRAEEENMQTMVNNMTHQCKIVESLLSYADWFFSESPDNCNIELPNLPISANEEISDNASNQALLLDNISKYEALKDQKEKNGALFSSIISAAQRKVKRKTVKSGHCTTDGKEEPTTPNGVKEFTYQAFSPTDLKQDENTNVKQNVIPTTVTDMEKKKTVEKVPWFNYSTDKEEFYRRVENFELETKAMLTMPRKSEITVPPAAHQLPTLSSSAGNVHQQSRLSVKSTLDDPHILTKTHSASNVFSRTTNANPLRNSLDTIDNAFSSVQYNSDKGKSGDSEQFECENRTQNVNLRETSGAVLNARPVTFDQYMLRRGSSVENINSGVDVNGNTGMKKFKYETEGDIGQRTSSLDSLNKLQANLDDGPDLVTTMTQLYDEKLKKESSPCILKGEGLPYADESPEKSPLKTSNRDNVPQTAELYRNPSLHKNQFSASKQTVIRKCDDTKPKEVKNEKIEKEKEEDSSMVADENVPDNERHLSPQDKLVLNSASGRNLSSKLKRSESLNKPDRTVSPLNAKLKRSESLNKTGDKLKRSDSLTKNEKTENNISRKRELVASKHRSKRKNGMPDRSIKRRHTVGGTKDPDKVNWLDNKYQEEVTSAKESNKEKGLRTSSPDLSSARRDRLLFEINLFGPENMVVALRQHLIGSRPQSFPETAVFKVPLESHV